MVGVPNGTRTLCGSRPHPSGISNLGRTNNTGLRHADVTRAFRRSCGRQEPSHPTPLHSPVDRPSPALRCFAAVVRYAALLCLSFLALAGCVKTAFLPTQVSQQYERSGSVEVYWQAPPERSYLVIGCSPSAELGHSGCVSARRPGMGRYVKSHRGPAAGLSGRPISKTRRESASL